MNLARLLALAGLLLTVGPAILFAAGHLSDSGMKLTMLVGTILWFAAAPKWLRGGGG